MSRIEAPMTPQAYMYGGNSERYMPSETRCEFPGCGMRLSKGEESYCKTWVHKMLCRKHQDTINK